MIKSSQTEKEMETKLIDEFIETLRKHIEDYKRIYDETEAIISNGLPIFDEIVESNKASIEQKALAQLYKVTYAEILNGAANDVSNLYDIESLAVIIKILGTGFSIMETQLVKSGILDKAKDIEGIKKELQKVKKRKEKIRIEIQEEYAERLDWLQKQMESWKRGLENAEKMIA